MVTHLHAEVGSGLDAPCGARSTPDAPLTRASPGAADCIPCLQKAALAGVLMRDQLLRHGMRGAIKIAWTRAGAWAGR